LRHFKTCVDACCQKWRNQNTPDAREHDTQKIIIAQTMSEHVSVRVQDAHKTPRSYRSKTACRNWSETGTCVYGRRCRFTHLLALSVETVPPSALPVVTVPSPSALPVVTVPAPSALPVVTVPTSSATHSAVYVPTVLIKDQAGLCASFRFYVRVTHVL
jgi:hypothetical protein